MRPLDFFEKAIITLALALFIAPTLPVVVTLTLVLGVTLALALSLGVTLPPPTRGYSILQTRDVSGVASDPNSPIMTPTLSLTLAIARPTPDPISDPNCAPGTQHVGH